MVIPTQSRGSSSLRHRLIAVLGLSLLAACQTPEPIKVTGNFTSAPALAARSPSDIAVLPVENGTADGAVQRHLVFLRQEIMRQLPDRLYAPLTATSVDAALRGAAGVPSGSMLVPATLQAMAKQAPGDGVLAVRVGRWDEARLLADRYLVFQFQAVLMAGDGTQMWSGTIDGEVKAGGAGPAPLDRDGMARSCGELAVREMLLQLPLRQVN
jgi:hypothetical protein